MTGNAGCSYKIQWEMAGTPKNPEWKYFSVTTRPDQRLTELRGSDNVVFGRFYYSRNGRITEEMLDRQLRRLTVADPEDFYATARSLGGRGGIGEVDLVMAPQKAASLQSRFGGAVKLVKVARKRKERRLGKGPWKTYGPENAYVVI